MVLPSLPLATTVNSPCKHLRTDQNTPNRRIGLKPIPGLFSPPHAILPKRRHGSIWWRNRAEARPTIRARVEAYARRPAGAREAWRGGGAAAGPSAPAGAAGVAGGSARACAGPCAARNSGHPSTASATAAAAARRAEYLMRHLGGCGAPFGLDVQLPDATPPPQRPSVAAEPAASCCPCWRRHRCTSTRC
ncbi:hypothetical protein C2845_PM01G08880 [Panicum miliaceum]|uniref:Uncharacterized protein n=1 Tax=Panicum miliaceum TaxID=4540 RepID=A0A3L6TPX8_PANMI|nr:hypothetical protein C2845_PM01G08880 [Panicum miliaceum]